MTISYDEFKDVIKKDLISYMGKEYEKYEVRTSKVDKINKTLDGFSLFIKEEEKTSDDMVVAPTLYADDFYGYYLDSEDIDEVMCQIADVLRRALDAAHEYAEPFTSIRDSKNKIVFEIINKKRNESLLENLPHRDFMDLAVVYRVIAGINSSGITSALVNSSMQEYLNLSEDDLFELALENTREILPFKVMDMEEVIVNMMKREGNYSEEVLEQLEQIPDYKKLHVITNQYSFCAASALLYKDFLKEVSMSFDSDLYIIPVSVNELMLMKVCPENTIEDMRMMISRSNSFDNCIGEVLSDNIYQYFRESNSVGIPYAV